MRRRGVIALSIAAHGAVIAAFASRRIAVTAAATQRPAPAAAAAIKSEPLAVELLTVGTATREATAIRPASAPQPTRFAAAASIDSFHFDAATLPARTQDDTPITSPDREPSPGHALTLSMRGDQLALPIGRAELALPLTTAEAIANQPAAATVTSAQLEQARIQHRGRELAVPDLQVPATVGDDGSVVFHDKRAVDAHWRIHLPTARDVGDKLAAWYADPYAQTRARPTRELSQTEQAVGNGWDPTGTGEGTAPFSFNERGYSTWGRPDIPIIGGMLDPTAFAMRAAGMDPYASRKRELLAATFDARAELREQFTAQQADRATELMQRNVAAVWASALPASAKREALFELWDECSEGDDRAGRAGAQARAVVIGFMHSHALFSPAEIAAYDARRTSTEHFAP